MLQRERDKLPKIFALLCQRGIRNFLTPQNIAFAICMFEA